MEISEIRMNKISAVIITFNEEKNIGRCIDSLKGIADEIVIVDSFSTDKTKEICIERGVKFIQNTFEGHIQQKNFAISQATYPHILSLDADESIDEVLKKSIIDVKSNWDKDGYKMNRLNNYCGKWIWYGAWYPDRKLRLWDSTKGRWGGLNPHDRFIMEKGCSEGILKGNLLHYRFENINEHIKQLNYFTDIAVISYNERGKKSNLFFIVFSPLFAFFSAYFLKLGFLSGYYGFVISVIDAHFTFIKYAKLRDYQRKIDCNKLNEET